MKNMNLIISILALALMGSGCSKMTSVKENPSSPITGGPVDIDDLTGGGGSGIGSASNTVELVTTYSAMNDYVGMRPLNDPKNIQVTVDLTKDARNRYSGTIRISYNDNGQFYQGIFYAGSNKNWEHKSLNDNNKYENEFNYWWVDHGQTVFSGFFQDAYGGLVLVIDQISTQGNNDGVGETVLSGSIWYRNFPIVQSQQSPYRKCWFITTGPFDCRSSSVINKNAIYPADTYRKLGTFSGLSKSKAFKTY